MLKSSSISASEWLFGPRRSDTLFMNGGTEMLSRWKQEIGYLEAPMLLVGVGGGKEKVGIYGELVVVVVVVVVVGSRRRRKEK